MESESPSVTEEPQGHEMSTNVCGEKVSSVDATDNLVEDPQVINGDNNHADINGTNGANGDSLNQDQPLADGNEFFEESRTESDEPTIDAAVPEEDPMDVEQQSHMGVDQQPQAITHPEPEITATEEAVEDIELAAELQKGFEEPADVSNKDAEESITKDADDIPEAAITKSSEDEDKTESTTDTEAKIEMTGDEAKPDVADKEELKEDTANDQVMKSEDDKKEDSVDTKEDSTDKTENSVDKMENSADKATDSVSGTEDVAPSADKQEEEGEKVVADSSSADKSEDDGKPAEVFTVDDDGKELPAAAPEEEDKTMPDEEYYKTISSEELEWYKDHVPDLEKNLHCTACFKQVTSDIGSSRGVCRHPHLGVGVCKQCRVYYKDGEWQRDEEGMDMFCRWCAEGGDLILCDKCPNAFCKRCLQRNLGRKFVSEITSAEEWKCLICDPKPLYEQRALYHGIFTHQQEILARKAARKKPSGSSETATTPSPPKVIEDFFSGNITEALAVLEETRKSLDEVMKSWTEANMEMNADIATKLTRELRKVYAISKQSMDQLDKSIVTSFVMNFPTLSKRIHMGKIDASADGSEADAALTPSPRKRKPPPKKKPVKKAPPPKKKIVKKSAPAPAKKKKPAPASAKKSQQSGKKIMKVPPKSSSGSRKVIVVNGRPVTGEYIVKPSLMGSAGKKRPAPASVKRKMTQYDSDGSDSDIEIIGSSAPPPLKKRKPGPKSRY